MSHGNDLDSVRELAVEYPVRKWWHATTANGLLMIRPSPWVLRNATFRLAHRVEECFSQPQLLFIIVLSSLGQFNFGNG